MQTHQEYDLFLSHKSEDNEFAQKVYDTVKILHNDWNIFFDVDGSLNQGSPDYKAEIDSALKSSKRLIFVSSKAEYCEKGNGWMYYEVNKFQALQQIKRNTGFNEEYFGIFFKNVDKSNLKDCFTDTQIIDIDTIDDITTETIAYLLEQKYYTDTNYERRLVVNKKILLDKIIEFAEKKRNNNAFFSMDAIIDDLIPNFSNKNKTTFDFNDLVRLLSSENVALIGQEGGLGKTTILTKLFFFYLNNLENKDSNHKRYIPIYIDLNTISAKNYFIERYLMREFFGETQIMTRNETDARMQLIENEFNADVESPEYLLILDGYNELPNDCINAFNKQLEAYLNYKNVRIIISGRWFYDSFSDTDIDLVNIVPLNKVQIELYLSKNSIQEGPNVALNRVLSIPMYLKMYVETDKSNTIQTKSDLLLEFMKRQLLKNEDSKLTDEQKIWNNICFMNFAPALAYYLAVNDNGNSMSSVSFENMEKFFELTLKNLLSSRYRRYNGKEYRDCINKINLKSCDTLDVSDIAIDYLTKACRLLFENTAHEYEFIHQIYRDFFAAYYIVEEMKMSVSDGNLCTALNKNILNYDIIEFIKEILKEQAPYFNSEMMRWNYDCNENSTVYKLLNMSRGCESDNAISVANLIKILRYSRADDLSNCDFSNLDLSKSELTSCVFYHFDNSQRYSSTFENSKINVENLFCEKHFAPIATACIKGNKLAVFDQSGKIMFWETETEVTFPKKIINGINFDIKKMIFSNNDNTIIAMSYHEIIKIHISSEFESDCNFDVLYISKSKIENIVQLQDGTIKYTTAFNHFNPKPIDNPNEPDSCFFYGLNTNGTINSSRAELAFGHFCGYYGLKIYSYDKELNDWVDKKFGYSKCLDECIMSFENQLKEYKLYNIFPSDITPYKNVKTPPRRSFFINLQQQFEDRSHKFSEMPDLILNRIEKELYSKKTTLYPNQKNKMHKIADSYKKRLLEMEKKESALLSLSGKEITSLEYKPGSAPNILLVTFIIDREKIDGFNSAKQNRYNSVIAELNTDDFSMKIIAKASAKSKAKSIYCDDKIIVYNDKKLLVFNEDGVLITHIKSSVKSIHNLICPNDKDTFYVSADQFIYEINKDLICINSFEKTFRGMVTYCKDETTDKSYLYSKGKNAIDLENGTTLQLSEDLNKECEIGRLLSNNNSAFKISNNNVILFNNQRKVKALEIEYKMYINGCSFKGIKGTLSEENNLKVLQNYGAVTDTVEVWKPAIPQNIDYYDSSILTEDINSMINGFSIPEITDETSMSLLPFSFVKNIEFSTINNFAKIKCNKKNLKLNVWSQIYKGSYLKDSGLFFSDYSVIEWVSRLNYATSQMIFNLMEAGIIQVPDSDEYKYSQKRVSKRLAQTLNSSYRLLDRSRFSINGRFFSQKVIYSLSCPYGVELFENMTEEKAFFHSEENSPLSIQKKLSLNEWFCSTLKLFKNSVDIQGYSLDIIFESINSPYTTARVRGYININGQPIFAESFRKSISDYYRCTEKVQRLCILASDYANLTVKSKPMQMKKQPIIVIICEDEEHCKALHKLLSRIKTKTKIIFTHDILIAKESERAYFEFINDEIHFWDINDVINKAY